MLKKTCRTALLASLFLTATIPTHVLGDAWGTGVDNPQIVAGASDVINTLKGDVGPEATKIWQETVKQLEESMPVFLEILKMQESTADHIDKWRNELDAMIEKWSTSIERFKEAAKKHNPDYRKSVDRYWKPMTEEYALVIGDIEEYGYNAAVWTYTTSKDLDRMNDVIAQLKPKYKAYEVKIDESLDEYKNIDSWMVSETTFSYEERKKVIGQSIKINDIIIYAAREDMAALKEFGEELPNPGSKQKSLETILNEWEIDALDYTYVSGNIIKYYPLFEEQLNKTNEYYKRYVGTSKVGIKKYLYKMERKIEALKSVYRKLDDILYEESLSR